MPQVPELRFLDILWLNWLWLCFVFQVFVLFEMYRILRLIQSKHRCCSPNTVWWCLIPVVGNFVLVSVTRRVAKSLSRQSEAIGSRRLFHGIGDQLPDDFGAIRGRYLSLFGVAFDIFWLYVFHNVGRWGDLLKFEYVYIVVIFLLMSQSYFYWKCIRKVRLRLIGILRSAESTEELDYLEQGDS